jgi:RHS repeat-associated protein
LVFDSSGNRIAEYDQTSGALLREYVWNGLIPVAVIENGVVYFVRVDHIGRPVFATNAAGAKVWTATYTPFGEVHASTGTPIALRFPGQWFQSESGLHQNWMRDYDPTTGRYLEADPLGLVDGASVYGYARQNPIRFIDPRGELGLSGAIAGGIGGAIAGGVAAYLSSDGCLAATAVGAIAGAGAGAVAGGLTTFGSGVTNAGAAALAQILANELSCYCEKQRIPLSELLMSLRFWGTTAGAGIGGYSGAGFGSSMGTRAATSLFGKGPYQGTLLSRASAVESIVGETISGGFSGVGEYFGGKVGGMFE